VTRVDLSEFISGFLAEAEEHLQSINSNLMLVDAALQKNEPSPRALRELFRSLHTIKGLAGMVGVEPIVELSHAMEAVVRTADRSAGRLSRRALESLLEGAKAMALRVHALSEGKTPAPPPTALLDALAVAPDEIDVSGAESELSGLDEAIASKLSSSEKQQLALAESSGGRAYRLTFVPSSERAAAGVSITSVRQHLAPIAEIVKVIPTTDRPGGGLAFVLLVTSSHSTAELSQAVHCDESEVIALTRVAPPEAPQPERVEQEASLISAPNVVRVDTSDVDAALDGLSALLVCKYRLAREVEALAAEGVNVRALRGITQELTRKMRDARASILALRMVAASELWARIPILVRGLRAATKKDVELRLDAGDVELDKAVAERIWPVLVHLIRNAVDHGLESPEERVRAGKSALGTLSISCRQNTSSSLEIVVEDDGAGVDGAQVAARAGRPVPTNDAELLELITLPGLSTRDQASSTSGRGMGLDIVRRIVVDDLGGELALVSHPGRGTRFCLSVPLTVAVIDAFRFAVGGQQFLVPAGSVEEFVDIDPSGVVNGPGPSGNKVALLQRRGAAVPLVDLSSLLGLGGSGRGPKAILVRRNDQVFAFAVQRLIDRHEIVVKPLEDPLVSASGVSGSADLGDGQPTLLLDLLSLAQQLHEAKVWAA